MPGVRAGQFLLASKIGLGDLYIGHGHFRSAVAEQLHDSGEAHPGIQHFCGVGMSKLMGDDAGGDSGRGNDLA